MKIAIISDLHIKAPDGSNTFLWDDKTLDQYLLDLLDKVDRIFLNGDIFELWKTSLPLSHFQKSEFEKLRYFYPLTLNTILNNPIQIISGNHDEYLECLKGKFPELSRSRLSTAIINSKQELIMIRHGQLDFWNKTVPYLGFFFTWLSGIVERILFNGSHRYLGVSKLLKKPFFKNATQINFFKKEIDKHDGLVCMVNGHTHQAEILRFIYRDKERLYINTGYFNGLNQDLTILDTENLQILSSTVREKDFLALKKKLKIGDIILSYNKNNIVSDLIAKASDSSYSHGLIYIGNDQTIESTIDSDGNGVQINSIEHYFSGGYNLKILRLRDSSKVPDFLQFINSRLGIKYATGQLFADALYFILKKLGISVERNIDVAPNRVVCFELIAQGLMHIGYSIKPEKVVAADLESRADILDTIDLVTN